MAPSATAWRNAVSMDGNCAARTPLRFSPVSTLTLTVAVRPVRRVASSSSSSWRTEDTAISTQSQCLVDGGDAQFGCPGGQRSASDRGSPVAVAVGLDDSHHLGGTGVLTQQPHVVRDGTQIDHGLGEDAGRQGYWRSGHDRHCPRK